MSLWTLCIYYNETCVKKCQEQLLLEALVKKLPFLLKKLKNTPTANFGMVGQERKGRSLFCSNRITGGGVIDRQRLTLHT